MNGQGFLRIVKDAFEPFMEQLGFVLGEPSISGRAYRVSFTSPEHVIVVSFEPGDEALCVLVRSRENGELSDIDDRAKTPRLADLNSRYMPSVTSEERAANECIFESVAVHEKAERDLLKAAKELRLVLPKYLHS